jgi:DNA-binding transcriptional regulator/RsmH inhibitor MraZ
MAAVIEADEKGGILLPREFRRMIKSKRFIVTAIGNKLELQAIKSASELRGKYKNLIKLEWEELEEKGEDFANKGRR